VSPPVRAVVDFSVALGFSLLVAFLGNTACGGSTGSSQTHQNFPPYTGNATQLFDDRIDPMAVGLADLAAKPGSDPVLRARTLQAEAVARARVSTFSVDTVAGIPVYRLSLAFVDRPFVRRGFQADRVEIAVHPDSPAFGVVKWLDAKLIGRTFVGFFHRFAGTEEPQIRFHLSADHPDVIAAVRDASALRELSTK
jgi:hypothetical protein